MTDRSEAIGAWPAQCAAMARDQDRERYLCALFASRHRRADLMALLAFNLELAGTAERVSDPTLGLIRLQWWRESIAGAVARTPREHPVVLGLAALLDGRPAIRALLEVMIDAREQDLAQGPPASEADFIGYLDNSSGALARATALVTGAEDPGVDSAVGVAGRVHGLVGHLRAVPFHAARGRVFLPGALLAEAGLRTDRVHEAGQRARLTQVIEDLAGEARGALAALRLAGPFAAADLPALLPAYLAGRHLHALAAVGHDPYRLPARGDPWTVPALVWARLRRRI